MATMGIKAQHENRILEVLRAAPRENRILILTKNVSEDFVFGVVEKVTRSRGPRNELVCIMRDDIGPTWRYKTASTRIFVKDIYCVILGVEQEFDHNWRKAVGEKGKLWLIATSDERRSFYLGRITSTTTQRDVTADGHSAEVAHIAGWTSAPMFLGAEVQTAKIKGIAQVFP